MEKNNSLNDPRNGVNLIQSNIHTNITLLGAPHHFDLMKSSCVNEEIHKFIRILEKLVKHLKCVSLANINRNRESFAQH